MFRSFLFHVISIHALREEGDQPPEKPKPSQSNFYPRPPRGGRPALSGRVDTIDAFLSTPSARRATAPVHRRRGERAISIHALREEGDP